MNVKLMQLSMKQQIMQKMHRMLHLKHALKYVYARSEGDE